MADVALSTGSFVHRIAFSCINCLGILLAYQVLCLFCSFASFLLFFFPFYISDSTIAPTAASVT